MNKSRESISTSGQPLNVNQSQIKQQMQIEPWLRAQGIEESLDNITEIYLPKSGLSYISEDIDRLRIDSLGLVEKSPSPTTRYNRLFKQLEV